MTKQRTVLLILADAHCGSTVGLIRPGQWQLNDGGYYMPSKAQGVLWAQFAEIAETIKRERKRSRLVVVHNGDGVDGVHHGTTQLIPGGAIEHERIHVDAMDWMLREVGHNQKRGDLLYYIGGTEAHVGKASARENRIARDLDAVPMRKGTPEHDYKDARHVWPYLKLRINGVLFSIAHHAEVNRGRRAWTKTNVLRSYLTSLYFDSLDSGAELPRYWIRSHYHKYTHAFHEGGQGRIDGFILPALQAKTDYIYRIAATELADIGAWYAVIEPDGSTYWECPRVQYEQDEVIEI